MDMLLQGLIGPHYKLYQEDPYFRYAIRLYATGLIEAIDKGIARHAELIKTLNDNPFHLTD
jgi:hypothetical protein